jgi:hypothetical protein
MRFVAMLVMLALVLPLPTFAQQQQIVRPPIAVYWMSIETASGMGAGGAMGMMASMMGRGEAAQRTMHLQLGSSEAAAGEPKAGHDIPPGLNMGPTLPLVSPKRAPEAPRRETDLPEGVETPKGRMKIYWGCGNDVRSGQPIVIDFAKVAAGQQIFNMPAVRVSVPSGPAPGRSRTYGDWPNPEATKPVPANASLRGDHAIKGNYAPEIRFPIGERHDFMAPVSFAPLQKTTSGGMSVQWKPIPTATGYFAFAIGATQGTDDIVLWSSSEVADTGGVLFNYIPPGEVARLIRDKVVLPPQTTECTVPGQVVKEMDTPFLRFIAYGDELNLVQPPRPQDPNQPWEQIWAVKVRLRSTAGLMLAEGMGGASGEGEAREERSPRQARPEAPPKPEPEQKSGGAVDDAVKEGVKIFRGIFGK